jgi:hypothetical protein
MWEKWGGEFAKLMTLANQLTSPLTGFHKRVGGPGVDIASVPLATTCSLRNSIMDSPTAPLPYVGFPTKWEPSLPRGT